MGLLKDFLVVDAARRSAQEALRAEAERHRVRIADMTTDSRRKRDEIGALEEELQRFADDLVGLEQELLELDGKRLDLEGEARTKKAAAVRAALSADRLEGARLGAEFRRLRSDFQKERQHLLAQTDTGRMMDNFFQIEAFLKDTGQPIPDAARKALAKERADLLGKIGPLVAPPPTPEGVYRATAAWCGLDGGSPRAVVALGLPDESDPPDPNDLPSALLYGGYAAAVERFGTTISRPRREGGVTLLEAPVPGGSPEETALELFLAFEEGVKKAAAALAVRCELTGVFVEPEIAAAVFGGAR